MEFIFDEPLNEKNGVILRRTEQGVKTNVPWLVVDHSPTGFEWGYLGSGPADLALNILEAVLRGDGHKGPKTKIMWNGNSVFAAAYGMHQEFKRRFIAGVPAKGGGVIPLEKIREFINRHNR